jgi:hypothetical protein
MIVLTTGLSTTHCSLAVQLRDLHTAIQEREQTIMGDPDAVADLIPQLAWAATTAAREFYGTISTRTDVKPPNEGAPKVAIAQLSIHTTMFKAGYRLNLTNLPDQWRRKTDTTTAKRTDKGNGNGSSGHNGSGQSGQDQRHGSNPFKAASNNNNGEVAGTNPNQPAAFNTTDLRQLKEKLHGVTLTDIVTEAGIRGGPSRLDTNGWPAKACLNWVCMGACKRPGCVNDHPFFVDGGTATMVYKQIKPGIKCLLETNKRPKQN